MMPAEDSVRDRLCVKSARHTAADRVGSRIAGLRLARTCCARGWLLNRWELALSFEQGRRRTQRGTQNKGILKVDGLGGGDVTREIGVQSESALAASILPHHALTGHSLPDQVASANRCVYYIIPKTSATSSLGSAMMRLSVYL